MKKIVVLQIIVFLTHTSTLCAQPDTYFVILAGGSGERLWPISRRDKPKQLVEVGPEEKTLLQQAIDRAKKTANKNDKIWIVTSEQHANAINMHAKHLVDKVLAEPEARNTAPAILYCCEEIAEENPNALAMFLPADPYIPTHDYQKFSDAVKTILSFSDENNKIGLLGVKPTCPATGYGYIEYDNGDVQQHNVHNVVGFHEKPKKETAQKYIKKGNMLWNIGMFGAPVAVFIAQFQQHAPELSQQMLKFMLREAEYSGVQSISVDNAIIEKSNDTVVLPVEFEWHDVGNVEVFLSIQEKYKKLNGGTTACECDCNHLIDVPGKHVMILGVKDLCVVERDNLLLVVNRANVEDVRLAVKCLKDNNREECL